jgi:hypothetical protein
MPAPDAPFVIGIVGQDPFGAVLADAVRGEFVGRHPLQIRYVDDWNAERTCQILYVGRDSESLLDQRQIHKDAILTVGESATFFRSGGVIQFFTDRRHLRLKINLAEARVRSLVISAKLLRVADVTDGPVVSDKFGGYARNVLILPRGFSKYGSLGLVAFGSGRVEFRRIRIREILSAE